MDKQRLKQYRALAEEAAGLSEEIKQLRAQAESRKWPDGLPHSNFATDRTAAIVAQIADLCEILDDKRGELLSRQLEIERSIEALEPRERHLMRLRYIRGMRWEEICVELNYAWAQAHRCHAGALRKIKDDTQ